MPTDASVASTAGAAVHAEGSVVAGAAPPRLLKQLSSRSITLGPTAGRMLLATLVAGTLLLAAFATGRASALTPQSTMGFPGWEAGPLHLLFGHPTLGLAATNRTYSVFLLVMAGVYAASLLAVRSLSLRVIIAAVIALHVILLLSPPSQLTDLFNYLGYARLGAVHHLNPYAHTMRSEAFDPVYRFSTWHNLRSPYGPLFTAITYPIAYLPLPVAYWVMKLLVVLTSLSFVWLVGKCAVLRGRDPRFAVLFVAANPVYLFYAVGGFHNDFFMLLPSIAAIMLLLSGRERSAGAMVMVAVAVKFTAILILPFLLVAAVPAERRIRVLQGAAAAVVPLALLSFLLFGLHLPDLKDQSTLLTNFSFPNIVGLLLGMGGGTPTVLRLADAALVPAVAFLLLRRRDWISSAGWATLALLGTLAWLVPWYIIWVLPLAALGSSTRLRWATCVVSVLLIVSFLPEMQVFLASRNDDPLGSAVRATRVLQRKLERGPSS